jgi:hypothetical protein
LEQSRNGGSQVTGYIVQIDDGNGGLNDGFKNARTVQDSLSLSLIIRNLEGGRTYKVRYAGRNVVYDRDNMFESDSLKWSPSLVVTTSVLPLPPLNLRQSFDETGVIRRYRTKLIVEWDAVSQDRLGSSLL